MKKILIIEDELIILENIMELLNSEGFEAYGAGNGTEGVRLAKELNPELIICDVMMPGIDGHKVLELLQDDKVTATIPFIFLSANAAQKDIRRGMNSGALDYITKPFGRHELLQAVRSRIEIADRVKQKMSDREDAVKKRMLREIPDDFSNLLNGIMGNFHLADSENENVVRLCDRLALSITVLIETKEDAQTVDLLKSMMKVIEAIKTCCSEQAKSLDDGLESSGKFYTLLQSLFRSIERN